MRPSAGVRYVLERAEETASAIVYRGFAHLPDRDLALDVRIELPSGAAKAQVADRQGSAEDLVGRIEQFAARLVRSATKTSVQTSDKGRATPPRKIVRWREAPT